MTHTFMADNYEGYIIYLHEKGQFWLNSNMEKLGQTKELYVPHNTEQESRFQQNQKIPRF